VLDIAKADSLGKFVRRCYDASGGHNVVVEFNPWIKVVNMAYDSIKDGDAALHYVTRYVLDHNHL
jgi:hypothetical protein